MEKKFRIVTLDIDQIVCDPELIVRVGCDDDTIDDYYNAMETEEDVNRFPKIIVYFDGWRYLLVDGHHRYVALLRREYKKITVEVIDGTRDEAILVAVKLNMNHGLRFKEGDWEKIITLVTSKKQWASWTNRKLAEELNCGETTIRRYRPDNSVAPPGATEKRMGKDGKMYKAKKEKKPAIAVTESPQAEETVTESVSISQVPDVHVATTATPSIAETSSLEPETVDESSAEDSHQIKLNVKQTQIEDTISHLETQLIEWLELALPDESGDFKLETANRLHALAKDFMEDVPS